MGRVVVRPTAALRVAGSIPARNKYGLRVVIPGDDFSIFENAPTMQELFQVWAHSIKKKSWVIVFSDISVLLQFHQNIIYFF